MKRLLSLALLAGCASYSCNPPSGPELSPGEGHDARSETAAWGPEGTGPVARLAPPTPRPHGRWQEAKRLRGGELDDNDRFEEYLRFRDEMSSRVAGQVHAIEVSERVVLRVVDVEDKPAAGAKVTVKDLGGRLLARRTVYADGRALFFPREEDRGVDGPAEEWIVEATLGDAQVRKVVARGCEAATLRLDGERSRARAALDVVFCLDCTGSMHDEIERLKATLDDVARRLAALPARPRLRFGLVKYRDRGDTFVTEKDDLVPDLATFRSALARAWADGGGDYPEDVQAGLAAAVCEMSWEKSPNAARLVFLVGDAPPRLYADEPGYAVTLRHAAEKGVKVCTLAASGLDATGEYVWRQLAHATLGRFIFLSYGTPGGGRGTPHHTGPYLESDLDEIVVRQCTRELEALTE